MANTEHKYKDVIIAWINGEKVQHKYRDQWSDFNFEYDNNEGMLPDFNSDTHEWRIKPIHWYRVWLANDNSVGAVYDEGWENSVTKSPYFKRWLTERIEYEV